MEPKRLSMEPKRLSMEPKRLSMEPKRLSMEPKRLSMEPKRNICRWLRVLLINSCVLLGGIYDIFYHQQNRKRPENLGIFSSS